MPATKPGRPREGPTDPVEVYCRIRPLPQTYSADATCLVLSGPTKVLLVPVNDNQCKSTEHTFAGVFDETSTQESIFHQVAEPLIMPFVRGTNTLIATYGVTNSGKTYTMVGTGRASGILPRLVTALFNGLGGSMADKGIIRPDRMNGFEVVSKAEAEMERMRGRRGRRMQIDEMEIGEEAGGEDGWGCMAENGFAYALFATHVEIYNNVMYDLLDDSRIPQSKILREDQRHNMYVHSAREVEVRSAQEAMELFSNGQKKRRVGNTALNAESSRSHAVFNLRLVRAHLVGGGEVAQDVGALQITQMSLVDLAGSERTNRTGNKGNRLRETGNINNSLMTLRMCLETLRENYRHGTDKVVSYRDSKLTHYLKNFFDGQARVRLVVCVNPSAMEYDENIQVMRFSEMSQEVQVARPEITPQRPYAELLATVRNLDQAEVYNGNGRIPLEHMPAYSLGPEFPSFNIKEPEEAHKLMDLEKFLQRRKETRECLKQQQIRREQAFRIRLVKMEEELILLREECKTLSVVGERERNTARSLEKNLAAKDAQLTRLQENSEATIKTLQEQLRELESEKQRLKHEANAKEQKLINKIHDDREKMKGVLSKKMIQQRMEFESHIISNDQKLSAVKKIVSNGSQGDSTSNFSGPLPSTSEHGLNTALVEVRSSLRRRRRSQSVHLPVSTTGMADSDQGSSEASPPTGERPAATSATLINRPLSNNRHRRSRSACRERWIDHRPCTPVALNTIFQPQMKKGKSVTGMVGKEDVVNPNTAMYCLTTQSTDEQGDMETMLYKADILPTSCGGAQVVFTDVEVLKQQSPTSTKTAAKRGAGDGRTNDNDLDSSGHKKQKY